MRAVENGRRGRASRAGVEDSVVLGGAVSRRDSRGRGRRPRREPGRVFCSSFCFVSFRCIFPSISFSVTLSLSVSRSLFLLLSPSPFSFCLSLYHLFFTYLFLFTPLLPSLPFPHLSALPSPLSLLPYIFPLYSPSLSPLPLLPHPPLRECLSPSRVLVIRRRSPPAPDG